MKVRKVVIPAAGLGTRLLPVTKEFPKEMLPIFIRDNNGILLLKPMMQQIFEELYNVGFREFCFIVGRGKRAIEDHFTSDYEFVKGLKAKRKLDIAEKIEKFYKKIDDSIIVLVNQPKPIGFGDAVHKAKIFTKNEPFLMHAGDDLILSQENNHIKRILTFFENYDADAIFFVEEMEDPRNYGVIKGNEIIPGLFDVKEVFEKPTIPPSNLASIALYVFKPIIYEAIQNVEPDLNSEIQLADAIKWLIEDEHKVYALKLKNNEKRLDIGNPESYLKIFKRI